MVKDIRNFLLSKKTIVLVQTRFVEDKALRENLCAHKSHQVQYRSILNSYQKLHNISNSCRYELHIDDFNVETFLVSSNKNKAINITTRYIIV